MLEKRKVCSLLMSENQLSKILWHFCLQANVFGAIWIVLKIQGVLAGFSTTARIIFVFFQFDTWQHTEEYKKYLRIFPMLPLIKDYYCVSEIQEGKKAFCRAEFTITTAHKVQLHPFFPTRSPQIEDNAPLNISSTKWEHGTVLHYAAIDLNIYTFFF